MGNYSKCTIGKVPDRRIQSKITHALSERMVYGLTLYNIVINAVDGMC